MTESTSRIDARFAQLKAEGKKAFVAYISAGDPHPDRTVDLVLALERAGADIIELGIPFSDPLADGVVNQLAAQRALEAGTTMKHVLDIIAAVRAQSEVPLVIFTYFNPIMRFGLEAFDKAAKAAGADGLLLLDLPPEEGDDEGYQLQRIVLVAPTTPSQRMGQITKSASGFIYYVSREGVTGMQKQVSGSIEERLALLRTHSDLPVCVGFGISTPEQAHQVAQAAEGVVVGSALVNCIAANKEAPNLPEILENFARPLVQATHGQ